MPGRVQIVKEGLIGGLLAREDAARDREAIRRSILACVVSEGEQEGVRASLAKLEPVFRDR